MAAHSTMPDQLPPSGPLDPGAVYLLCFTAPFGHARHYLGWAARLPDRLRDHYHGNGKSSQILKAAHAAGVRFACVRWWPGDRHLEHRFKYDDAETKGQPGKAVKGRHGARVNLAIYCPRCCTRIPRRRNPAQVIAGFTLPAGWTEPPSLF